jgi:EXS family
MVRPMQDIAFTVCYILFGLRGWWSDHYFESTDITAVTTASVNSGVNDWTNSTALNDLSHSFLDAADARVPAMERSWILHTAILPACMISPLWWRFLQTMRQCYDTKQRWPYLGNSFKYFFAAQVAMLGVYHPGFQHSPSWILSFVAATLYQVGYSAL